MHIQHSVFLFSFIMVMASCTPKQKENVQANEPEAINETSMPKPAELETPEEQPADFVVAEADEYICYNGDGESKLAISIGFKDGKAVKVKYKGQSEYIPLMIEDQSNSSEGAYPVSTQVYSEMYQGKANGTYELTHSGIWDYATYTRAKDGKTFKFTIDHELTVEGGRYRTTPCY